MVVVVVVVMIMVVVVVVMICSGNRSIAIKETFPLFQVCGVVFFGSQLATQILSFHVMSPLDACTYIGIDSGSSPIQARTCS